MIVRARSRRLFRRAPDQSFTTLDDLAFHCSQVRHTSRYCWEIPTRLAITSDLKLAIGEAELALNDWSFGQLCGLARLDKRTLNRLTPRMASQVLQRMLPQTNRPWEVLATWGTARAVHGLSYSRLWNCELIAVLREFTPVWHAPLPKQNQSSGLVCGEQDMFCFLIDTAGAVEVAREEFIPGVAVWNSEVGRRPLGIQPFWFQPGCHNHFLWDPVRNSPVERKHIGDVRQGLEQVRLVLETLERRRSERRDAFVRVVRKAQRLRLGHKPVEVLVRLLELGIPSRLARQIVKDTSGQGRLTVFAVAEALTRLSQMRSFMADRTALDTQAAALLTLAE